MKVRVSVTVVAKKHKVTQTIRKNKHTDTQTHRNTKSASTISLPLVCPASKGCGYEVRARMLIRMRVNMQMGGANIQETKRNKRSQK